VLQFCYFKDYPIFVILFKSVPAHFTWRLARQVPKALALLKINQTEAKLSCGLSF